ncbi:hypothetical protein K1T71_011559 [Dendrolimus kikuchii]|uniref:Uncharacterized protein n=1 Tax=Dendrolimus kikuchii TaxID=765133 RepID=A0ACC1CPF8_9NEOP|nr:hypothetical protein K1T71_011559 [Dendrolimus kikuchii]
MPSAQPNKCPKCQKCFKKFSLEELKGSVALSRFAACVNASTSAAYNMSARLYRLEYCRRAGSMNAPAAEPLSGSERAFAGVIAALLALTVVCTVLDLTLSDHAKKGASWALTWSVRGSWRILAAPPPNSADTDLRCFDGLRVLCMMCVIIEHVCWLTTQAYLADTRRYEMIRSAIDVVLMANSTLMVQIFFMMSSFLLGHKLLTMRRRGLRPPFVHTFFDTMFNRIIRISPSYFLVVWFAGSWWERLGRGPLWPPLVGNESAICQAKWWTHLLYLNNVLYADDKCLIQTWYLAADMQLYALALLLTLALWRLRRGALCVLVALLVASVALLFGLAYHWQLVPTFVMHSPELVRATYKGESSFNVMYQSPLSNAPGALAGLLLAHLHHYLLDNHITLHHYRVFRWVSVGGVPLAAWWMAASPLLPGRGPPSRAAAAALAAFERPVFALFGSLALLGALHGVQSPVRRFLSWSGWSCFARLSFGALLLHMPINKSLVAARLAPAQLDRQTAVVEWFGVCAISYLAALPLALMVEIPALRLHRTITGFLRSSSEVTTNNNITAITTAPQKTQHNTTKTGTQDKADI